MRIKYRENATKSVHFTNLSMTIHFYIIVYFSEQVIATMVAYIYLHNKITCSHIGRIFHILSTEQLL